jgi:hypothetical protein
MKLRSAVLIAAALILVVATAGWAQQPGQIFGKVTDASGAVMPGVSVTLTGRTLLQPMAATSSATGTYQFPGLAVDVYTVKFELSGFKTFVRDGVRVEIGANVQINASLEISTVQETVTVTGETPVVDLRDTSKTSRFTQEALQSIPSARDPWVIIEQSAGVAMDRSNVGGSQSGQQSNFIARGAAFAQQKWNLDGVDITDMSATGGSPVYFDFDAFEEMQIGTGGADVTAMTPGVSVNLVTKSGTDKFRGSGRYYVTSDRFQSNNVTDALRVQGATSGNPIQDIKDYGVELGGPIKLGRAWFWGAYGKQDIKAGINNFYLKTDACKAVAANALNYKIDDVRACLNTDETILNNYNFKLAVELFKNNQFSWFFNGAEKIRNARGADDLHPIESTNRQMGVDNPALGSSWWKTGMPKTYKWSDRYIFSDKFMMEYQYAHVGNNFVMAFHDDSLAKVQPTYELYAPAGLYGRSFTQNTYVRPTDSIDVTGNYFIPGWMGGDHTIKFGTKYRNDVAHSETLYGGNALARLAYGVPYQAEIRRDSYSEYQLRNRNFYIQDTFSRKRLTINFGIRFDYQTDESRPGTVPAVPFYGQPTFAGTAQYCTDPTKPTSCTTYTLTGRTFDQLPAVTFKGAKAMNDSDYAYKNWAPRVGVTYDVTGDGKSVVKFSYARYTSQAGTGDLSSTYTMTGSNSYVRYPWIDLNGDKSVQANEIMMLASPLASGGNYDWRNPTAIATPTGKNDPNIQMDHTDEAIVSFDRQIGADFAVGAAFIYRKYSNIRGSYTTDGTFSLNSWSPSNYVLAAPYTPSASSCGTTSRCETVTYYTATSFIPSNFLYTDLRDYYRTYKGFELTARKRMSHRWMMNGSFSWNDAPVFYASAAAYQDPTNIDKYNGGQYAPQSTTSGIDNVFVNAKWIARVSAAYTLPLWDIGLAGFANARAGFPFLPYVQTPDRGNGIGASSIYLEKWGDNRLPNFWSADFRLDKPFTFARRVRVMASMDIFNLFNGNTILSERRQQNSTNANTVSAILAPRVIRFGFRVTF